MYRRHVLAATVAGVASLAGCVRSSGTADPGRLDRTVRNERADSITVRVEVVGPDGTAYEDDSDQVDGGVSRAFEVVVGREGRHEATVSGDGSRGQLGWNAATCRLFDGRVRVTDELVEVAGECVGPRYFGQPRPDGRRTGRLRTDR